MVARRVAHTKGESGQCIRMGKVSAHDLRRELSNAYQ